MAQAKPSQRRRSRAPRRVPRHPVLVREVGTLRCWAAQLVDWSLTGSKLAGFPRRGDLTVGTSVELIEGLDVDSFETIAPLLSQPDLKRFEDTVQQLRRRLGLRRSTGKVVRVEPEPRHFAIQFDEVLDDGRVYPLAHGEDAPLKATFTYKNRVGVLTVNGDLTVGAAIDLAKDVISDIRQCLGIVNLSAVRNMSRIALEKFRTRLHSELNEQDLACALAVVSPEEWVRETLEKIQTYPTLQQAQEAVRAGLTGSSEQTADEALGEEVPSEPSDASDTSSDKSADKELW